MGGKGSGGRRPGAGRRPAVDHMTALGIGAEYTKRCNALARRAAEQANRRKIAARDDGLVYENYKIIQGVPVRSRATVVEWGNRADAENQPDNLPDEIIESVEAMRSNRRMLDQRDGRTPPLGRYHSSPIRRSKGVRQRLIAKLARKHSVSKRTVRTVITEYNKFLKK